MVFFLALTAGWDVSECPLTVDLYNIELAASAWDVPDVPVTADFDDPDIDTGECPPGHLESNTDWVTGCLPLQCIGIGRLKDAAVSYVIWNPHRRRCSFQYGATSEASDISYESLHI